MVQIDRRERSSTRIRGEKTYGADCFGVGFGLLNAEIGVWETFYLASVNCQLLSSTLVNLPILNCPS